ncbi:hypothetical protein MCAL160_0189 [Mycoplasmopsis californica HAZ160_1]|uniref:Glycerol-3-phosphate acyltransferase n=1 Tax=Mycoplasmopsis californica HAZ160_1 TaxID=1397850 RepID=A0AAT9F7K0_9BACT|nr:glycerol-3-phosphate 1-O-acyltransferase PlsY [Mycoplasmopsis californica]BAP00888.1 hypothetical protein MCAL160_0189 [Mycoplasmopsis californica HAZ160_1]BBG40747.1 hypothetical protein MCAL106_0189 [Mycoplasmopsis californica]BBG41341.1 hypothetical protein MCAL106E_0189 [Mycoplasmopsis californica]BBG41934.1 hypothetical protein MCAL106L_0189 [Mycoplasmopsis californica]BBG42524.1 hypothetical protein MCAL160E_0189 [Mycoplasmopsis californica]
MIKYPSNIEQFLCIIALNIGIILVGYLIGSFNTSIILSRRLKKSDIRNHNSQNAGATNSLRTYGFKFAITVYLIDFLKVALPTMVFILMQYYVFYDFAKVYWMSPQSIGFGVIIGHCWPIFYKFKGGKGVACTSAYILVINPAFFIIAAIIFLTTVIKTKKVSLGSIITPTILTPLLFIPWFTQGITGFWLNFVNYSDNITPSQLQPYWFVTPLYFLITTVIVITLHRGNIKRLIAGSESQLSFKNKHSSNLSNPQKS